MVLLIGIYKLISFVNTSQNPKDIYIIYKINNLCYMDVF